MMSVETITDDMLVDGDIRASDITSVEQADELWEQVSYDKAQIETQLEYANAFFVKNGYHEDPYWQARAKAALGFKKRALSIIQNAKSRIAKSNANTRRELEQDVLIEALRKAVGEERFLDIARNVRP